MTDKSDLPDDDAETRAWENREYGADPRYAELVSDEEDLVLDECLGLQVVPVRLEKELVAELDRIAKEEGLADHIVLIRNLACQYVRNKAPKRG